MRLDEVGIIALDCSLNLEELHFGLRDVLEADLLNVKVEAGVPGARQIFLPVSEQDARVELRGTLPLNFI